MSNPKDYAPDPVAAEAAEYATKVTDTTDPHPMRNRFVIVFLALFILIGTLGAITGTLNTVALTHQNGVLTRQQKCQTQLLRALTEEQTARSNISADDRKTLSELVNSIAVAKNQQQIEKALLAFNKHSEQNDKKRARYPVPTFSSDVCSTKAGQVKINSHFPTPSHSSVKSSSHNKPSATAQPTPTPGSVISNSPHVTTQPKTQSAKTSVTTRTVIQKPSAKPTAPAKRTTQSSTGLLPISGCTISVGGIQVC